MATPRLQKEENAKQLREELTAFPHAILVDFQGLNVEGATDLRRKLRDGDARFRVVKNSTALRAIEGLPLAELKDVFEGQTAIAYTDGDVVTLAKTLREFAEEFETPAFKAGIVDGASISEEEFEQLADLPPREELIAKALYLMNYPITGLATALNAILRGFVVVLEQIREKREAAGEAEPVADEAEAAAEETPAVAEEEPPAEEAEVAEEEEAAAEETPPAAEEEPPAEEAEVAEDEEAAAEETPPATEEETPAEEAEPVADEATEEEDRQ